MAAGVGFEATHPRRQGIEGKDIGASEEAQSSPLASPKAAPLSPDLAQVVLAWPGLRPELRAAILAIIASTK